MIGEIPRSVLWNADDLILWTYQRRALRGFTFLRVVLRFINKEFNIRFPVLLRFDQRICFQIFALNLLTENR